MSIGLFVLLALLTGRRPLVPGHVIPMAVACGSLDMFANALYLIAVRQGQLSLVATLASLYPASTVLLARGVLGEHLSGAQRVGVVGAIAAVVLIVSGSN